MEELSPQNQKDEDAFLGRDIYFFADKALRARNYPYAEEAFRLILDNYPQSGFFPKAIFGLAVSKQKQGFAEEALLQFRTVIEKSGSAILAQEAQFQIGEIYYQDVFDLEKAIEAYKTLLNDYPGNKFTNQVYFRLGDCNLAAGKYADAAKWYFRSKSFLDPRSELYNQAAYKIAYLHFLQADYDTALVTMNEILDKISNENMNQDYANDALELSFLIQENKDKNPDALRLYSSARKAGLQKNYTLAADTLKTILEKFPSAPIVELALLDLGNIESLQGNYQQSISNYEKLLNDHPESVYNALAQKRIAEIHEIHLADLQKAFQAYEKVLVNYPMSVYTEEVRQKLRELQGRQLNN
jgi:TolA-binding protein